MTTTQSNGLSNELKSFFENHPLAHDAAKSIKDGREIQLDVCDGQNTFHFLFKKENGKNSFTEELAESADLVFTIPQKAASELVQKEFQSVGQVGLFIFNQILSQSPDQKIKVKLKIGFLGLMTGGYLGVLTAGGTEIAKFLATKGLGSFSNLKAAIKKLHS